MSFAAPAIAGAAIPVLERGIDRMWNMTERGVGWLADKIFGNNSQRSVANTPEYARQPS